MCMTRAGQGAAEWGLRGYDSSLTRVRWDVVATQTVILRPQEVDDVGLALFDED